MDIKSIRYVITLAEELHFGRAAQRHYISPQPFGQRVRQLERELGFALFERSSRRVALTPRGERFVFEAREAVARFEELAQAEVSPTGDDDLVVGVLGFGLGELWALTRQLLQDLSPGVRLVHRDLDFVTQYRLLLTGEVDVAVVHHIGPMEGLVFDVVHQSSRVAVVPRWSELAERCSLRATDLDGQHWTPVMSMNPDVASWLGPSADVTSRRVEPVRRPDAVASAVATTGAVGLHAALAARYYPHPDVLYVPLEGPAWDIAVATRDRDARPAVQAFRRAVAAALEVHSIVSPETADHNDFA